MAIYASYSERGFFDDSIHSSMPSDVIQITKDYYVTLIEGQAAGKVIHFSIEGPILIDPPVYVYTSDQLSSMIDDQVAEIYTKWTRFSLEHTPRESAAKRYKDAEYDGDVPVLVSSYADSLGIEYKDAADRILSQSEALRVALEELSCKRMEKHRLQSASSETLLDTFNQLTADIRVIESSVE